ncbi:MAG: DedA family protein [Methanomassiliicoccales archaeon]
MFPHLNLFAVSETIVLTLGYAGVFYWMFLDNAILPLGGEALIIFAGVLAKQGSMSLATVITVLLIAAVAGSVVGYAIGRYVGRPILVRYGKYVLIREGDLRAGEAFFAKHGDITVFLGRLVPLIRTYISIPAGLTRMKFIKFLAYSLPGIAIFIIGLAYLGYTLSGQVKSLLGVASTYSVAGGVILLLLIIVLIVRKARARQPSAE